MTTHATLDRLERDLGELLASRKRSAQDKRTFTRYRRDPVGFIRKVLGAKQLWSKQVEIAEAVRDDEQVAVMSANGIGKDFIAAGLMLWWVFCRDGLVLLTGPGERTILEALMRNEVARLFHRAKLWGTLQTAALRFPDDPTADRRGILAMTSAEIARLGGHHAPRVLVVVEEAMGVEPFAWHAMTGCAVGEEDRYLAIGNPDSPEGEFFAVTRPKSGWRVIQVSALESPNVVAGRTVIPGMTTRKGIERLNQAGGGETSPLYVSRVLGRFPDTSTHGLFRRDWLDAAVARFASGALDAQGRASGWVAGVDPAGSEDGDETALAVRRGPVLRAVRTWREPDTMKSAGEIVVALRAQPKAERGGHIVVDIVGLGKGLGDRLKEQGWRVLLFHASAAPLAKAEQRFLNRRAEVYWQLRERFERGAIAMPDDPLLVEELLATDYRIVDSSGKIALIPKAEIRARLGRSPDRADAVAFAFATTGGVFRVRRVALGYGSVRISDPGDGLW
jgi:hypothetical protein